MLKKILLCMVFSLASVCLQDVAASVSGVQPKNSQNNDVKQEHPTVTEYRQIMDSLDQSQFKKVILNKNTDGEKKLKRLYDILETSQNYIKEYLTKNQKECTAHLKKINKVHSSIFFVIGNKYKTDGRKEALSMTKYCKKFFNKIKMQKIGEKVAAIGGEAITKLKDSVSESNAE